MYHKNWVPAKSLWPLWIDYGAISGADKGLNLLARPDRKG